LTPLSRRKNYRNAPQRRRVTFVFARRDAFSVSVYSVFSEV